MHIRVGVYALLFAGYPFGYPLDRYMLLSPIIRGEEVCHDFWVKPTRNVHIGFIGVASSLRRGSHVDAPNVLSVLYLQMVGIFIDIM
jgi:hypothetical protein